MDVKSFRKKNFWNLLTNSRFLSILIFACLIWLFYGGVAQLARAFGSYPKCHRFESSYRYHSEGKKGVSFFPSFSRPVGQVVKTPPFHGGIVGSIPARVTTSMPLKRLYKAV